MLIVISTNGKQMQNRIIISITHPKRILLVVTSLSVCLKKIIKIITITYKINKIINAVHRMPSKTRIKIRLFNSLNGGKIKFIIPNTKVIIIANTKKTPAEFLNNMQPRINRNALKASIVKNYFK